MPTPTTRLQMRKPLSTEAPDGAGQIGNLADDADQMLAVGGAEYCATTSARDAIPTARCFTGKLAYCADVDSVFRWNGTGWMLERGDAAVTYSTGLTDISTGQKTSITRTGRIVAINLEALTATSGLAGNSQMLALPQGVRPPLGRTFMGSMWLINTDGSTNTVIRVAARYDSSFAGGLYFQSYGLGAGSSFGSQYRVQGSMTYPGEV